MKFKVGDVVIKTTGGNKMTIQNCLPVPKNSHLPDGNTHKFIYECYWFIESSLKREIFFEKDIVTIEEYKRYLKIEERDDKLNKILNHFL